MLHWKSKNWDVVEIQDIEVMTGVACSATHDCRVSVPTFPALWCMQLFNFSFNSKCLPS
jgi:hypothetical protein